MFLFEKYLQLYTNILEITIYHYLFLHKKQLLKCNLIEA